jgi:TRAP-type C4-dicarboxylate transport system permease small subunit
VETAGVAILAVIVALVFGNAVARYGLRSPIIWSDEIVISLMPWLAMCGVFLSVRRRQLIRIDFFVNKLHYMLAAFLTTMAYVLSSAMFVYFAFISFDFLSLFGMDRTVYLRIPRGWFISAFTVGAAAVAIAFLINAVRAAQRRD